MEDGYRIPDISEFKQGFEFEVAQDSRMVFLKDDSEGVSINEERSSPMKRTWSPAKVYWMHEPDEIIKGSYDSRTFYMTGGVANFFKPFDVESLLKQGLIRVKK